MLRFAGLAPRMATHVQKLAFPIAARLPSASSLFHTAQTVGNKAGDDEEELKAPEMIPINWDQEWIEQQAEELITRAYGRHHDDMDHSDWYPVRPSIEELETIGPNWHYPHKSEASTLTDKMALFMVNAAKPLVHAFFQDRYLSHACVLEVVAACPGMVAGAMRHLRSLARMERDNGWIPALIEESMNERAHLITWLQVMTPSKLERVLVVTAQAFYLVAYAGMYLASPKLAHRFVGYLEEEATRAYTDLLNQIDAGDLENSPAPPFAMEYYNLPPDATLRDVVLHVRADEMMHAIVNHRMAEIAGSDDPNQALDVPPKYPSAEPLPPDHPDRVATRDSIHSKPPPKTGHHIPS